MTGPEEQPNLLATVLQAWVLGAVPGTLVALMTVQLFSGQALAGLGWFLLVIPVFALIFSLPAALIGFVLVLIAPDSAIRWRTLLCLATPLLVYVVTWALSGFGDRLGLPIIAGFDGCISALWCWWRTRGLFRLDVESLGTTFR